MSSPVNHFNLNQQTALLERVRAGESIRAAAKAMGFAEITVFKLRARDPIFKTALIEAQAIGKQTKAARVRRNTRVALAAVTPPASDPVVLPQHRPSDGLRALVGAISGEPPATAGEPIAIGKVEGGVLYVDAAMFATLLDAAQRGALPGA